MQQVEVISHLFAHDMHGSKCDMTSSTHSSSNPTSPNSLHLWIAKAGLLSVVSCETEGGVTRASSSSSVSAMGSSMVARMSMAFWVRFVAVPNIRTSDL